MLQIDLGETYALISYNAGIFAECTMRGRPLPTAPQMRSHLQKIAALIDQIEKGENQAAKPPDAPPISGEAIGH